MRKTFCLALLCCFGWNVDAFAGVSCLPFQMDETEDGEKQQEESKDNDEEQEKEKGEEEEEDYSHLFAAFPETDGNVGLKDGHLIPEITGKDLEGNSFNLSDYKGKVIMLDFWGDW